MSDVQIIKSACAIWGQDNHLTNPRFMERIDNLGLKKQATDVEGARCEHVFQMGSEDIFSGTLAVPLSDGFFVVDFA